jgi:hypothetical protein
MPRDDDLIAACWQIALVAMSLLLARLLSYQRISVVVETPVS